MLANKTNALAVLGLLAAASTASGQGLGNSPYSRLGLGDVNMNTGGVRQQGMGGVGVWAPNTAQVNELNPALLYYTNRTTFEMAAVGQLKRLRSGSLSQVDGGATLSYLAFAVPVSRRWGLAAGIKPYSIVDYTSSVVGKVAGDPTAQVLQEYRGTGGLSEVYLAHGVRVAKGLTLGLSTSYVFGAIDQSSSALVATDQVLDSQTLSRSVVTEQLEYSDFTGRAGLHYRHELSSKLNANLGAVYTLQTKLGGSRQRQAERQSLNGATIELMMLDTDARGEAIVPSNLQLGFGLDNGKNWSVGADVARQQWSKFEAFRVAGDSRPAAIYQDTWRAAVGTEITPDPGSVQSYFQRVVYRFGLSMGQLPYRPGGQTQYDRAVSWGFMLPIPSASALDAASVNLGFTYGRRGADDVLTGSTGRSIQEDYMRVQLGFSLNNRWFLKRKIE
ncbi:hypothetical protein [Hymenobacter sp. B81]|uniref:hypothetical protein n=1 Tax=Hymenobacter sp. B81 TaxID=3344878 RepID=UPI0037DD53D4